ncbi:hypothetical protein EVAR_2365_1 [Eumeta japonica]|uniref:Uncharacterized protein n=1 Tax=Eumeta variegata TaxID=151549 RepID=A0A4C1SIS2_EUMVA|nr:hypothetical protein EVAR_2365_1 [Eumeta japonica]
MPQNYELSSDRTGLTTDLMLCTCPARAQRTSSSNSILTTRSEYIKNDDVFFWTAISNWSDSDLLFTRRLINVYCRPFYGRAFLFDAQRSDQSVTSRFGPGPLARDLTIASERDRGLSVIHKHSVCARSQNVNTKTRDLQTRVDANHSDRSANRSPADATATDRRYPERTSMPGERAQSGRSRRTGPRLHGNSLKDGRFRGAALTRRPLTRTSERASLAGRFGDGRPQSQYLFIPSANGRMRLKNGRELIRDAVPPPDVLECSSAFGPACAHVSLVTHTRLLRGIIMRGIYKR